MRAAVYGNGFGIDDGHAEDKHGKKIFVSFALPGESALVKITNSRASFEEGDAISITANPNPERAVPPCPHFGVCGGCNLQHWQPVVRNCIGLMYQHLSKYSLLKIYLTIWLPVL